jgi:hypothetical protein
MNRSRSSARSDLADDRIEYNGREPGAARSVGHPLSRTDLAVGSRDIKTLLTQLPHFTSRAMGGGVLPLRAGQRPDA